MIVTPAPAQAPIPASAEVYALGETPVWDPVPMRIGAPGAETGQAVPGEPILFTKSPSTLVGPYDDVRIPRGSAKTDREVELGIVIGRRTSHLDSVEEARDAIAGYCVVNDVNGVRRQTGTTKTMIFDPYVIVHHPSQFMELGVDGLGRQRQQVVGPR